MDIKKKLFGVLMVSNAVSRAGGNPDTEANRILASFGFKADKREKEMSQGARPAQGKRFVLETELVPKSNAGTFRLYSAQNDSWDEILTGRVIQVNFKHAAGLNEVILVGGDFTKLKVVTPSDSIGKDIQEVPFVNTNDLLSQNTISINEEGEEVFGKDVVREVKIGLVRPFAEQPRKFFDLTKLNDLADSIEEWGQQRPAIARELSDEEKKESGGCQFELIGGERRWRAIKLRGIETIKLIVRRGVSKVDQFTAAFMDNYQGEPQTPYENIRAIHWFYKELQDIAEIKRRTGFSVAKIKDYLRLEKLDPEVLEKMSPEIPEERRLRLAHAKMLVAVKNPAEQKKIYRDSYAQGERGIGIVERKLKQMVAASTSSATPRIRDLRRSAGRSSTLLIQSVIELNGNYDGFRSYLLSVDEHTRNDIEGSLRSALDKLPRLLTIVEEVSKQRVV